MTRKEMTIVTTTLVLLKAHKAFKSKETPEGDEYARRALKALKYLRTGDIERCQRWCRLLVVTK